MLLAESDGTFTLPSGKLTISFNFYFSVLNHLAMTIGL